MRDRRDFPGAGSDPRPATAGTDSDGPPRRVIRVLVTAQILSGAGLAAGITVGALLARDVLGATALAGLPSALFTAGSALAAVGIGRLSQRRGRRVGLATGYAVGAVGSTGVIIASVLHRPAIMLASLFVYGAGMATNLQARYAGADLAAPDKRARAISTVLVATTVGGVIGPNLAMPSGGLAAHLGIPRLAGPFLLATAAYAAAALVLALRLNPDPLLLARERAAAATVVPAGPHPHPAGTTSSATLSAGMAIMVVTQLIMLAVMTMTPVDLHEHGFDTTAIGLAIAVHVAAMYLPSPLTGWLVDRYGGRAVAVASAVALLLAGTLAATAPPHALALATLALALLGLGWNLGLVAGTTIVTASAPLDRRASTQGTADVAVAVAGAAGGMGSGVVVAHAGYPSLALGSAILALSILAPVVVIGRTRAV